MTTKTMAECLKELRESPALESMDAAKTERIGSPSLGDVVRQGDLYLTCIEALPSGKATKERQLVPGTTQGAKHVAQGDVEIVKDVQFQSMPNVLVGPAFKCNSDVTVTHVEHGDKILPAGTVWQCTYQIAYADEIKRVLD